MAKTVADVMKMVKDNEVKFIDFRFTRAHLKKAKPLTVLRSPAGKALKPLTCC